jgi:hypothetical protein
MGQRVACGVWVLLLGLCCVLPACGDDDPAVPFDSIPKDKPLIALSSGEQKGTCQWAEQLAKMELMPNGQPLMCGGSVLQFNSCSFPSAAQTRCTATVGQWEECLPSFFSAIADDPCQVLSLAFSQTELESFVNGLQGCAGLGPCAYTIRQ